MFAPNPRDRVPVLQADAMLQCIDPQKSPCRHSPSRTGSGERFPSHSAEHISDGSQASFGLSLSRVILKADPCGPFFQTKRMTLAPPCSCETRFRVQQLLKNLIVWSKFDWMGTRNRCPRIQGIPPAARSVSWRLPQRSCCTCLKTKDQ